MFWDLARGFSFGMVNRNECQLNVEVKKVNGQVGEQRKLSLSPPGPAFLSRSQVEGAFDAKAVIDDDYQG